MARPTLNLFRIYTPPVSADTAIADNNGQQEQNRNCLVQAAHYRSGAVVHAAVLTRHAAATLRKKVEAARVGEQAGGKEPQEPGGNNASGSGSFASQIPPKVTITAASGPSTPPHGLGILHASLTDESGNVSGPSSLAGSDAAQQPVASPSQGNPTTERLRNRYKEAIAGAKVKSLEEKLNDVFNRYAEVTRSRHSKVNTEAAAQALKTLNDLYRDKYHPPTFVKDSEIYKNSPAFQKAAERLSWRRLPYTDKYGKVQEQILQAIGLSDDDWKTFVKQTRFQGAIDTFDGFAGVAVTGPILAGLAAPGASEVIPDAARRSVAQASMWLLTSPLAALIQLGADSIEDKAATTAGTPAWPDDVAKAPPIKEIQATTQAPLKRADELERAAIALLKGLERAKNWSNEETKEDLKQQTVQWIKTKRATEAELRENRGKLKAKWMHSKTFVKKYQKQGPYRVLTGAGVAAAAASPIPFVGAAAALAQHLVQMPVAARDEVTQKRHILIEGFRNSDFRTDEAKRNNITPSHAEWKAECIDPEKIKALWRDPVDILNGMVAIVYAEKLASVRCKLDDIENKILKTQAKQNAPYNERTEKNLKNRMVKLLAKFEQRKEEHDALIEDIGHFQAGLDKIKEQAKVDKGKAPAQAVDKGKAPAQDDQTEQAPVPGAGDANSHPWSKLRPDGLIARLLTDPTALQIEATKARALRKGEYATQVLDRLGGFTLSRAVPLVPADAIEGAALAAGDKEPVGGHLNVGAGQVGVALGTAAVIPAAKQWKGTDGRAMLKGEDVLALDDRQAVLRTVFKKHAKVFPGNKWVSDSVQVKVPGSEPLEVPLNATRALYRKTTSTAVMVKEGAEDFAKGWVDVTKRAATAPIIALNASQLNSKMKAVDKKLAELEATLIKEAGVTQDDIVKSETSSIAVRSGDSGRKDSPGSRDMFLVDRWLADRASPVISARRTSSAQGLEVQPQGLGVPPTNTDSTGGVSLRKAPTNTSRDNSVVGGGGS